MHTHLHANDIEPGSEARGGGPAPHGNHREDGAPSGRPGSYDRIAGSPTLIYQAGAAGKANLKVKGKGTNLAMPTMPLAQDTTVTVQLLGPTGGICWDANFSAPAKKNDESYILDKSN